MTELTDKEVDVLWNLSDTEWLKPMMFGARNGSHHSNTARRLCDRGLAEKDGYFAGVRHVYRYRRTPAGKEAFEADGRDVWSLST